MHTDTHTHTLPKETPTGVTQAKNTSLQTFINTLVNGNNSSKGGKAKKLTLVQSFW